MGLFDGFQFNAIERAILKEAQDVYRARGMSKNQVREMLERVIAAAKAEGTYNLPPDFGNIVLGEAQTPDNHVKQRADHIRGTLPVKRAEGVTDADIRYYWNLNEIERRWVVEDDNLARMAAYMQALQESPPNLSRDEVTAWAAGRVRVFFPMYGDPLDRSNTDGDDRPLPYELKDRVNRYLNAYSVRFVGRRADFEKELRAGGFETVNAFVRSKISKGHL
jgi:hypothetical protein